MPSGGGDSGHRSDSRAVVAATLRFLRLIAAAAITLLIVSLLALPFAPRDAGTLTLYGLVIGFNLLTALLYWPAVRFLQRFNR